MKFLMLESFFFITLGISCVLLLMLIYHFKQRLSKVEQNNETMFEILNNIVQELTEMKRSSFHGTPSMPTSSREQKINVSLDDDDIPELNTINDEEISQIPNASFNDDDSLDDNSEDDSSIDESDDEESDDSQEEEQEEEEVDTSEKEVKTVSVEIDNSLDEINENEEIINNVEEESDDDNLEEVDLNTEEVDNLKVSKLEEVNNLEENESNDSDSTNKDVYKKMTVPALKALVIEKGLTTETSKLKKNDLIDLLESNA